MPRATPDGMKVCCKCKENKPVGEFSRQADRSDGLRGVCKRCCVKSTQHYRNLARLNTETGQVDEEARAAALKKAAEYKAAWRAKNPEKERAYKTKWATTNPDKARAQIRRRATRARERLTDSRVKAQLKVANPTPELIELKREQLLMRRMLKQLKKAIEEESK